MATRNAGIETDGHTIDELKFTQLSHKHSVDTHRVKSIYQNLYKYFESNDSILITDYSLSLRACLLEYFIYKRIQSTNRNIIFLHISEIILKKIHVLDVKKSKLFGGNLTRTPLDYSKKIFTITFDDYHYLADKIIPTSPRDGLLYIYFANDAFSSSQLPGFQDIQNLVMVDKLLPSYFHQVLYPFIHFYYNDTNSKTKIFTDDYSKSISVPDYLPISRFDITLLDMLVDKYSIQKQTRIIEYLTDSVMDCIERRESVVIDGFSDLLLLCLLDYIIEKRLERAACLYTLIHCTQNKSRDLHKLEVIKTKNYTSMEKFLDFSKEVIFLEFSQLMLNQPVPSNCILVSYALNGFRFKDITFFQGPFISLTTNKLKEKMLYSTHRSYTRITYSRNTLRTTYWNGIEFLTTEPVDSQNSTRKFEISKDIFVPPAPGEPTSITNPTTDLIMEPTTNLTMNPITNLIMDPTTDLVMEPTTDFIMEPFTNPTDHIENLKRDLELYLRRNPKKAPTDDIKFTQLSHKHSVETHSVKSIYQTLYKDFESNNSILITDYSLSLRTCLLEYFIYKQTQSTNGRTVFLHISNSVSEQIPELEFFGSELSHTHLNNHYKIFTISFDDYHYLANKIIPTSLKDGLLYIYLGNDAFNSSQLPGFQDIQNLVMVDKLLPSYSHQVLYPFIHFYYNDTNSKTKISSDDYSKSISVPDYLPISRFDITLMDMLVDKYSIQKQTRIIEYLATSVMDCIEGGESMVVEGFSDLLLLCLLDYIIEKRLDSTDCLYTLIDTTRETRVNLQELEITRTGNYETVSNNNIKFSKRVLLLKFTEHILTQLVPHNCVLVSYTLSGCNFKRIYLFQGSFLSLSTSKVEEGLLSSISRPYTRITHLKDGVRSTYWNGVKFLTIKQLNSQNSPPMPHGIFVPPTPVKPTSVTKPTTEPITDPIPISKLSPTRNTERNEPITALTPVSDTLPHPRYNIESMEFIPNEPFSPNDMKRLLERLTMKYNCNLDVKICYTLYELLENGESVIIDYFSRPQLLYIMDFIFAIKTYQKSSILEIKTLIHCPLKWLDSVFRELDVVRSNQYTIVMLDGSFDRNRKILMLEKLGRKLLAKLNQNLLIDSSYLLVRLAKKRNAKFVNISNHLNSCFLGLSEGMVKSFPNKPFIHIRGNGFGGFKIPAEETSNSTEIGQVRDDHELLDSISIPKLIPVPDYLPVSHSDITLLGMLVNKYSIQKQTRIIEYLAYSVMDCIERGESMVIDGFSYTVLLCLLDYIIEKRLESATTSASVCTLVNFTDYTRKEFDKLQVMETNDYELVTDGLNFSKRVVFFKLRSNLENISYENCILISYTVDGFGFRDFTLFKGPFVSLSTNLLSKSLLTSTSRPYRRISDLWDLNEVNCTFLDGINLLTVKPVELHQQPKQTIEQTIPTTCDTQLLDALTNHNTPNEVIDIEYLFHRFTTKYSCRMDSTIGSTLYKFLEERRSLIIDKISESQLLCILDFVLVVKTSQNLSFSETKVLLLCGSKRSRTKLQSLDILCSNNYSILQSDGSFDSNKGVLVLTNIQYLSKLNVDGSYLLISYSRKGKFAHISSHLNCSFLGLCVSEAKSIPNKIFIHIRSGRFKINPVELQTPLQEFTNCEYENEMPVVDPITQPEESTDLLSSLIEKHSIQSHSVLLQYLTSSVMVCVEREKSMVIDGFSIQVLTCLLDYIIVKRMEVATGLCVIVDHTERILGVIPNLEVMKSNDFVFVENELNFSKKVLFMRLNPGVLNYVFHNCILVSYTLTGCNFREVVMFRGPFFSFTTSIMSNSLLSSTRTPYTRISYSQDLNEVRCTFWDGLNFLPNEPVESHSQHDQGAIPTPTHTLIPKVIPSVEDINTDDNSDKPQVYAPPNNPVKLEIEDDNELLDSISIPDIPLDIYPLFLDKYNPITSHIYELLNKFVIELLYTDLPTDLYVTTFTYLIEYRNICVDGFPFEQLTPLLTVYALECHELGIPVSIYNGNDMKLLTDKLQNIPIILNTDLIQTLTENVNSRHIWIFIGVDFTLFTQIIPLLNKTHQVIFLQSNTVSAVFERSHLVITRIYKFLDCVFVRSFNQQLLQECINDTSRGKFDTETPLQMESDRFVDIETNQETETPKLVDNYTELSLDTSMNQELMISTQTVEICSSLKYDTGDSEMTNISLAEFKISEIIGEICKSDLIETKSESKGEFIILSRNHTPNIPDTDNILECNNSADLKFPSVCIEASSDCVETDILHSNDNEETLVITETKVESFLPEFTQNSNSNALTTDVFHRPMDNEAPELESSVNSTESASEQISQSQQGVVLPEDTNLGSNSCNPSEFGTQLVTSPLQHGMNTILYSCDSTFYKQMILRIAEVLDYSHPSLQVVITSQNPDICSKLLKLASLHLNSSTRGFLYKFGPINSLRGYIIQHKVQILALPLTPLVNLIKSDNCLFIDNKILVYVDDSTVSRLDNHNLQILTHGISDQYIFILPDKRTFSSFPSPYCEVELSPSAKHESYFVEFTVQD